MANVVSSGTRSFDLKTFYSPFPDKEWMTTAKTNNSSNGNIYTSFTGLYGKIYQHTGDDYFNSYIMMALKKPADSSFTRFVYVSDSLLRCQYSNIETDKNGNIYIVFHGFTDTTTSFDYSLFFTKSTDSGKTFTKPVKITPLEIPLWSKDQKTQADEDFITNINLTRNIGNSQIAIDNTNSVYNGNIYLVWDANGISQKGQNGLDIYFSKSTDGGNTWSQPVIINNDPKGIVREQHDPCIYINPGGDIILGWYDRRNDPNDMLADFYIAYSQDGK